MLSSIIKRLFGVKPESVNIPFNHLGDLAENKDKAKVVSLGKRAFSTQSPIKNLPTNKTGLGEEKTLLLERIEKVENGCIPPEHLHEMLCRVATAKECLKYGMPLEHLYALLICCKATNGNGHGVGEFIAKCTKWLPKNASLNYTILFPKEYFFTLDKESLVHLTKASVTKKTTKPYEIIGSCLVNQDFVNNRLVFTSEKKLTDWSNYYNLTPNSKPDYVLVLHTPFALKDQMKNLLAYDLKTGQLQISHNIVKACYTQEQLIGSLRVLHINLIESLSEKIDTHSFSPTDKDSASFLKAALESNLTSFSIAGHVSEFRRAYHGLHEQYSSFLCRHDIGYNFVVHFDIFQYQIPQESKTFFAERFDFHKHSPDSPVHRFSEKVDLKNAVIMESRTFLKEFAEKYLDRT